MGYYERTLFIPTSSLTNVGKTENSKFFRFAVIGLQDAHFRFSSKLSPYEKNDVIHEIGKKVIQINWIIILNWYFLAIGARTNSYITVRRQHRKGNGSYSNTELKKQKFSKILSAFRPFIFQIEFFNSGLVELTRAGETTPFFSYWEGNINTDYINMANYVVPIAQFFDCPFTEINPFDEPLQSVEDLSSD